MRFICIIIKNHFHINGFTLNLALKKWLEANRNSLFGTYFVTSLLLVSKVTNWGQKCKQKISSKILNALLFIHSQINKASF